MTIRHRIPYEQVLVLYEAARNSSKTREEFQVKWSTILSESNWTRKEFHDELDWRFYLEHDL